MNIKKSNSLEKLKKLRSQVVLEEKQRTQGTFKEKVESPASPRHLAKASTKGKAQTDVSVEKTESQETHTPLRLPSNAAAERAVHLTNHLNISISGAALEKLTAHMEGSTWTLDSLVDQVLMEQLHTAYPRVTYRGLDLATAGRYRFFDRVSHAPALFMRSDKGTFKISVRQTNESLAEWILRYQKRDEKDAHRRALEMCSFLLQQQLEKYESAHTVHLIYPEDYLVERFA